MRKLVRYNRKLGSPKDFYELARFAAYVLERNNNFDEVFKVNYRDIKKNIMILNDNDGITWTAFKGNPPEYYHDKNTVHITHFNKDEKSINMYWPARKCVGEFKWNDISISD